MRIRIRGPSGQKTINIDDNATIEMLKTEITTQTSLTSFDIKYGYPPKPLILERHSPGQKLAELDVRLNGEQLIVTPNETAKNNNANAITTPSSSRTNTSTDIAISKTLTDSHDAKSNKKPSLTDSGGLLSLTRKQNTEMTDPPEVFVPEVGGTLVLRIMPDDNSCLFRAIASAVMSDMDAVTELRDIVAGVIQADPVTYNKAVLDNKDPDQYCRWIKGSDSWGGQVELLILSQYFNTEIRSIDVQTLRVDKYNEGADNSCFVVYSGIHYDTIALSLPGMTPEDDVKQFTAPIRDEILPQAVDLCRKLRERHYYTDTAGFKIKCNDCGAIVTGETGATQHAASTGHYNFGEAA